MKRWIAALAVALAFGASAHATEIHVGARETATLTFPGVLAAFALDTSTVEASTEGGRVLIHGRRAGRTLVTVVLASTFENLTVVVEPPPPFIVSLDPNMPRDGASWDARYDSGTRRLTTGVAARFALGERVVSLRLDGLYDRSQHGASGEWALPFASVEIQSPGRVLVLLDQFVKASPLVLDNVLVRGVHLRQGPVEFHAGVASTARFDDVFVPSSGDRIVAASIEIPRGDLRISPGVAWLPDSDGNARGIATLGLAYGTPGDRLRYGGEIGWGGRAGAAFDLQFNDPRRQVSLAAAVRPDGFAALRSVGRPAGSFLDGAWTEWLGERSTVAMSVTGSRLDVPGLRSEASSGRVDARTQASEHLSFTASLGGGAYRGSPMTTLRRGTIAAGAAYDAAAFGLAAQYRYQDTSAAEHGGHGGRLSLRANAGGWRGTAFVDAQQQAPTVDLILQDRSDLARGLAELGLSAGNPEDLVRLLRDNAALFAAVGITLGDVRSSPLRIQGGLDVSWRDPRRGTPEIGLRLLADDVQAAASRRRSYVGTVYANWNVGRDTDLAIGYSRWSMRRFTGAADERGSVQASIRMGFSHVPLPGIVTAPISGIVVRDEAQDGAHGTPLADVEVMLDRTRRTRTDDEGRFVFERPGSGAHRVDAVLPSNAGAFFLSASSRVAKPGDELRFGLAFSAARITGTVRNDAGIPIEGVTVQVDGSARLTATTDSSGRYRIAAPVGATRISILPESMPPGHELRELAATEVLLHAAAPASADFVVRAQRSIEGRVRGAVGAVVVTLLESGREAHADAEGRFVLRNLPSGSITLVARCDRGETRLRVDVPASPGAITGIELTIP